MVSSVEDHLQQIKNLRDKRILITGGAGFLGTRLVSHLARLGASITVLDLPEALANVRLPNGVKTWKNSLLDYDQLRESIKDHEVVVHLAAVSDVTQAMKNPRNAFMVTDVGTQNVLEAIRLSGSDPQFVLSSSFVIYKSPPEHLPIDEDHPKWPTTPYSYTKICQEEMTSVYGEIYGLRQARLRLSAFFGPGQPNTNVMLFMTKAMKNEDIAIEGGSQTRDWYFIDNVVYAIIMAVSKRSVGAFNIGGGREVSIMELVTTIVKLTGSRSRITTKPYRVGESPATRVLLDLKKSKEQLGYEVLVPFSEGLGHLHDYVRSLGNVGQKA